jgi:hypothetical protein
MHKLLLILSLLLFTTICQAQVVMNYAPFIGQWEDSEDKPHTLLISEKHIIEKYNNSVIDTFSYNISNTVCDSTYKKQGTDTPLFMLQTNIHNGYQYCYEVAALDGDNLILIYVFNGYLAAYKRRKE